MDGWYGVDLDDTQETVLAVQWLDRWSDGEQTDDGAGEILIGRP